MASAAGHLQVPEEASVAACPASLCKRDCSLPRFPFASLKSGFEVPAALRRGTTAQGNQATASAILWESVPTTADRGQG